MADVKEASKLRTELSKSSSKSTEVGRRPGRTLRGNGNVPPLMRRFVDEMDQLFEDFGLRMPSLLGGSRDIMRGEFGSMPMEWSPRIDVRQRNDQIFVSADLPGLAKDDIKVEMTDQMLTIQGERKQERQEEKPGYSYSECSYGSFYRSIPLPEGIDTSKATAEFRNGVLEIAIPAPATSEPQARRLEIQERK